MLPLHRSLRSWAITGIRKRVLPKPSQECTMRTVRPLSQAVITIRLRRNSPQQDPMRRLKVWRRNPIRLPITQKPKNSLLQVISTRPSRSSTLQDTRTIRISSPSCIWPRLKRPQNRAITIRLLSLRRSLRTTRVLMNRSWSLITSWAKQPLPSRNLLKPLLIS